MKLEERIEKFEQEIQQLQKKYGVQLYAADVLLQNGELTPLIKMRDLMPETKMYDNNTKEGNTSHKKT